MKYQTWQLTLLSLCIGACVTLIGMFFVSWMSAFSIGLGSILLFFLPGLFLSYAVMSTLSVFERIVVGFGLSFLVIPLLSLGLTAMGIMVSTFTSILIAGVCITGAILLVKP